MAPCTVFAARCPLGQDCTKKGSLFVKKLSEDECMNAMKHHLKTSPYHEMSDEAAQILADELEVESWDDDSDNWKWKEDEENQSWYDQRKKRKTHQYDSAGQSSSSAGQSSAIGAGMPACMQLQKMAKPTMPEPEYVQVSKIQLQAFSNKLKNDSNKMIKLFVLWVGG